jgi:hypothetical protein
MDTSQVEKWTQAMRKWAECNEKTRGRHGIPLPWRVWPAQAPWPWIFSQQAGLMAYFEDERPSASHCQFQKVSRQQGARLSRDRRFIRYWCHSRASQLSWPSQPYQLAKPWPDRLKTAIAEWNLLLDCQPLDGIATNWLDFHFSPEICSIISHGAITCNQMNQIPSDSTIRMQMAYDWTNKVENLSWSVPLLLRYKQTSLV